MAELFNKIKTKAIIVLCILCAVCFSLFFMTACGETPTDDPPHYSLSEVDPAVIQNGSFEYDSYSLEYSDYPKTSSITGWSSAATDNSSTRSSINSGVINVNSDSWAELVKKLYDDSGFLYYLQDKCDFSVDDIKEDYETRYPEKSEDEIAEMVKEFVVKTYIDDVSSETVTTNVFKNPGTHEGANGTKIYMLNNYVTNKYGVGTAMKITSSSTVTLEKGTYGKITVFINTRNLQAKNTSGKIGANITLSNAFQSNSQAVYGIYGIDTNSAWKQYTIYVKADDFYSNTVTVSLGLGYGNGTNMTNDYVEGTVFFDDLTYEKVDEIPVGATIVDAEVFKYKGEEGIYVNAANYSYDSANAFVYSMSLSDSLAADPFKKSLDVSEMNGEYVRLNSNGQTTETLYPGESSASITSITEDQIDVTVDHASYGIKIENESLFRVEPQNYFMISFYIENNLSTFDANGVSVYVYDVNPYDNIDYLETKATTLTAIGDKTLINVLIKNTFPYYDETERTFYLYIVIGAADFKNVAYNDLSSGNVTLSDFNYYTGNFNEYDEFNVKTENYDYYTLFNSNSTVTVALHAGYQEYSDASNDSYYLEPANEAIGEIVSKITPVKNYLGVTPDTIYIDGESESDSKFDFNTRVNKDADGNYAGLLNSKFVNLGNYETSFSEIKSLLDYNGEKNIQAIVINNQTASSYGFIGKAFKINASTKDAITYAKISVKVKVVGDAKANVYLVDCSELSNKDVATLKFTGNIDGYNKDKEYSKKLCFENITADLMGENGWLTLTFYVSAGSDALNLRLEMWNGSRTGETSQGTVFYTMDAFTSSESFTPFTYTSAFSEPTSVETAFITAGNPLSEAYALDNSIYNNGVDTTGEHWIYNTRALDKREIRYNSEQTDETKLISYDPSYVWAFNQSKDCTMLYAMYGTINPVSVDPYASSGEDEKTDSGCAGTSDPATFWMSLSSILLAVALVFALVTLIIKKLVGKRKANATDAKSHYKVTSRYSNKEKKEKILKQSYEDYEDEKESEEDAKSVEAEELNTEKTETDEYVYGEVMDFGTGDSTEKAETEEPLSDVQETSEEEKPENND